jgi:hypothetical protein
VVLVDETFSTSSTTLHLPASVGAAAALADTIELAGHIDTLSGAGVTEVAVTFPWVQFTPPAPAAGARVNPHGAFIFECGAGQWFVAALPGILPALVLPPVDGARLDLDQADDLVVGLVELLVNGFWCNPFGYQITGVAEAYIQQRTYGAVYIPQ